MIPGTLSVYPVPFPGPHDPAERVAELCDDDPPLRAVRARGRARACRARPPAGTDPAEARRVIVEGFRQAAKVAAEHGLTLGMEPLHRSIYGTWTTVYTIPETIDADGRDRRAERAAPVRRVPPRTTPTT